MIKLFDDWVIEVDSYNYTLAEYKGERKRIDKHGVERMEPLIERYGYYRGIGEALKALRGIIVRRSVQNGLLTLSEALRAIEKEDEKVIRMIESIGLDVDDGK